MSEARSYYMELRCLLYMAACVASFPLYRRPRTWRSIAWLSIIACIIINLAYVGLVCVFIWNATLPNPLDKPEVSALSISVCITAVKQAGVLVSLSIIGIRKDGLHHFLVTLKKIRNQVKPRPGKEPHLIFKLLNIYAAIYIVMMGFVAFFVFSGIIPNKISFYYKDIFASFIHTEANFKLYIFIKSPLEWVASIGAGLAIMIFMTSVVMVRREINVFCENLKKYSPWQMTSSLLGEVYNDHESLLVLLSVTSRGPSQ